MWTMNSGARRDGHAPARRPLPAQVLDLQSWKVGLPIAREVKQPALADFSNEDFEVVPAVTFTVHCGDTPQPGTKYARSELREMRPDGRQAAWSTTSGRHRMTLRQRVTHLPVVKPHLIVAQIHNTAEYLIVVKLDARRLFVRHQRDEIGTLDEDYRLGTYYDLVLEAADGVLSVTYNGAAMISYGLRADTCYFKAGCYLQSNTAMGDAASAYGQVDIARLTVEHTDR